MNLKHQSVGVDHRVEVAARKREKMRLRLLEATLKAFSQAKGHVPTIDDVVKTANVSRGTFYLHFRTVDEAFHALSQALSNQMTQETLDTYGMLKEPWQRFSVGFRGFLKRAHTDPVWAMFVTRSIFASDQLLVTELMGEDLRRGQEIGQFHFTDLRVALDFMMCASVAGIRAIGLGVSFPDAYMDASVRMALVSLGCSKDLQEKAVKFSRDYLEVLTPNLSAGATQGISLQSEFIPAK